MKDLTQILQAIQSGDRHATDDLLPAIYDYLRSLAAQKLAHEKPGFPFKRRRLFTKRTFVW